MLNWKSALVLGGSVAVCGIAALYLKRGSMLWSGRKKSINQVLMYGGERKNDNMICVMCVVGDAAATVDVCFPQLTNEVLAKNLVTLTCDKPVKVRILVHKEQPTEPDSLVGRLKDKGIEVRCGADEKMRHEFILVDGERNGVLLMGALDRPMRDGYKYHDNAVLTSVPASVNVFVKEFERLWAAAGEVVLATN